MKRAPRFVFASDSLKGTLSSADTARLLGAAAERHFPGCSWTAVPMADGGEGTVDALLAACGGEKVRALASDPLGRPIEATYALLNGDRAVIETAAAPGCRCSRLTSATRWRRAPTEPASSCWTRWRTARAT